MITNDNEQNRCKAPECSCKKCVFLRGTPILHWIKNKYIWLVFCGIILLFFIWGFTGTLSGDQKNRYEMLNVLFSGLAFAAVIITIRSQNNQFKEELRARKKEEIYSVANSISEKVKNISSEVEYINKMSYNSYILKNEITIKNLKDRIEFLKDQKDSNEKTLTGSLLITEILNSTENNLNLLEYIYKNKSSIPQDEDILFLLDTVMETTEILLSGYQNLLPLTSSFLYCCHLLDESKNILNDDDINNLFYYIYTIRTHEEIKILMITTELGKKIEDPEHNIAKRVSILRHDKNSFYNKYSNEVINTFLELLKPSIHPARYPGMFCKTLNEGLDLKWPLVCKDEKNNII